MGRVRWKRVGDGIDEGDDEGVDAIDAGVETGAGDSVGTAFGSVELLCVVIVLPMKPPIVPARTAMRSAYSNSAGQRRNLEGVFAAGSGFDSATVVTGLSCIHDDSYRCVSSAE
jgi:hypothetical protein